MAFNPDQRLSTGIDGLDEITGGGVWPRRWYLVRGQPGSGKTTSGMHFLAAGREAGERCLFLSLEKPIASVRQDAEQQHFDLTGIDFLDLSPGEEFFSGDRSYNIFSPAEIERGPIASRVIDAVETLEPDRVFVDSLTMFRYLVSDPFLFRRQIISFMRYVLGRDATVVASSEINASAPDDDLQFLSSGVVTLHVTVEGRRRYRTLSVDKLLGSDFREGRHAMRLGDRGIVVYPLLLPEAHHRSFTPEAMASGIDGLDAQLRGGVERGTVTILSGPTGVGKTTLACAFVREAARRGERSVLYTFEENRSTILQRTASIGIPVEELLESGALAVVQVEPFRETADELASWVRQEVEDRDASVVIIDSISGYRLTLLGEDLTIQLYALCRFLRNTGVTTFLTNEVERITGDFRVTDVGISHLADNIIFMRYLEIAGELRKAIGVLKKRVGSFERALRELEITAHGIEVGRPLTELRGIMRGTPEWAPRPTGGEDR